MTTHTAKSPAEVQAEMETILAKLLDGEPSPEKKAEMVFKMTMYRGELMKMAPMLNGLDQDSSDEYVLDWLKEGDTLLKTGVFNALAGAEELPLAKAAPDLPADLVLVTLMQKQATPEMEGRFLHKLASYREEFLAGMQSLVKATEAERADAIAGWIKGDDGSDTELRKAIADSVKAHAGAIYGDGHAPENPVKEVIGNASTHGGKQIGDSSGSPDSGGKRLIPRAPAGEGAGRNPDGGTLADGGTGETTDVGSGPNDKPVGGGDLKPGKRIKRKGATGGLGNSAGADSPSKPMSGDQDKNAGGGKNDWDEKNEKMMKGLVEAAPQEWLDRLTPLPEADQVAEMVKAAGMGLDLVQWAEISNPDKMQKSVLDESVVAWLTEDADPKQVELKKFVAEALATAEEIPLSLAKAIMEWQPARMRLRRLATA